MRYETVNGNLRQDQIPRTWDCEGAFINLQVSTFVSSHSPELWTSPEEFNPYRFDDEELVKRYESTNDLFKIV